MNNNQIIGRSPGDIMKAGAIIAIVSGSTIVSIGILFSIITILMGSFANTNTIGFSDSPPIHFGTFLYGFAIFTLIFSLLNIPSIIVNIMLLKGKLKSSIVPGILAIVSLGLGLIGIISGILILSGKFEDEINNNNEDFFHKNFNVPKWTMKAKPETASSWRQTTNETLQNIKDNANNNVIKVDSKISEKEE